MTLTPNPESRLPHLKAIVFRLNATPTSDLPRLLPYIPQYLAPCKGILASPQPPSSDAAAVVHQLKTRTSSLLQDRTAEGRFAAVVLVKSLIDLGEWEILHASAAWVRGLINILNKPSDSSATKKLCVVTLVRIFLLAHEYDSLVREIATPNIPPFVTSCLNILQRRESRPRTSQQRDVLETILRGWAELMPKHPTIFRPFITQIQTILAPIVGLVNRQSAPIADVSPGAREAARKVHAMLHSSATKNGSLEDRETGLLKALTDARNLAAQSFGALYGEEDFRVQSFFITAADDFDSVDEIGRTMHQIQDVLDLLNSYITTNQSKPSTLPIGSIVVLLQHISGFSAYELKSNTKLAKHSRQSVLMHLPSLHMTVLDSIMLLIRRFGMALVPVTKDFLRIAVSVLEANTTDIAIRTKAYTTTTEILTMVGYSMTEKTARSLHPMTRQCCTDLAMEEEVSSTTAAAKDLKQNPKAIINPNAIIGSTPRKKKQHAVDSVLYVAASDLLVVLLARLPATSLPALLRTEVERTAILSKNAEALRASVLNPPTGAPSLLPFAVRLDDGSSTTEAILRPRMPVITKSHHEADIAEQEDKEETMNGILYQNIPQRTNGDLHKLLESPPTGMTNGESMDSHATSAADIPTKSAPLASEQSLVSTKHLLLEPSNEPQSPTKKARFDIEAFAPPTLVPHPSHFEAAEMPAVVATSPRATPVNPTALFAAESGDVMNIDIATVQQILEGDEDESDFEMPPLVLAVSEAHADDSE